MEKDCACWQIDVANTVIQLAMSGSPIMLNMAHIGQIMM
jgi:hypothetical protein